MQAVFVFGFGQGPAVVTKNYGQLAMNRCPCTSRTAWRRKSTSSFPARRPKACGCLAGADDREQSLPPRSAEAHRRRLREDLRDKLQAEASTFGGYALDALNLAVDAIKRAGSTDKAKVRDALEQTKGFVGTTGVFNMSAADHMGLDLSAFRMVEIKYGQWALVQ